MFKSSQDDSSQLKIPLMLPADIQIGRAAFSTLSDYFLSHKSHSARVEHILIETIVPYAMKVRNDFFIRHLSSDEKLALANKQFEEDSQLCSIGLTAIAAIKDGKPIIEDLHTLAMLCCRKPFKELAMECLALAYPKCFRVQHESLAVWSSPNDKKPSYIYDQYKRLNVKSPLPQHFNIVERLSIKSLTGHLILIDEGINATRKFKKFHNQA